MLQLNTANSSAFDQRLRNFFSYYSVMEKRNTFKPLIVNVLWMFHGVSKPLGHIVPRYYFW